MEVVESQHYRDAGEQAKETLRLHGEALDKNRKRSLEVDVMRAENLKKVERATGLTFDVFRKGDPRVAAFITVGEQKTFMAAHSLDDLGWALYAAKHERKHKQTKDFMQLGDKKITVFEDQFDVLKDELRTRQVDLEGVNWVEGFTDLLTAREVGTDSQSGYADREVPAAEKLDDLCIEKTGASLAEAFNLNNVALFTSRLRRLSEVLMMEKAFEHLASQDDEVADMRGEIAAKMRSYQPILESNEDAEKAVGKMIAEAVALKQIRRYVGQDENFSSVPKPAGMLS